MTTVGAFAVSSAHRGCSTAGLQGLNDQIVAVLLAAVNHPPQTRLISCSDIPGLSIVGNSTIPLLQLPAVESLRHVIQTGQRTLGLIHALRTIAQQFVLLQWRINGKCNIASARQPGSSDHEKGLAIDIEDSQIWKQTLVSNGWVWAGPGDRGHFSFHGSGVVSSVLKENVRAFQRLWNLNHPESLIDEDGIYGPQETEPSLIQSPVEGFPNGL